MNAKKCDLCGNFYISDLDSKVTADLTIPMQVKAQAAGMSVFSRTTIVPMIAYGTVQKPLDVCEKCKRRACFETGKAIRMSFGGAAPGTANERY